MKSKMLTAILLFSGFIAIAQTGINYKAQLKDSNGNVIANDLVQIQFTILQGATVVYEESHNPTTDANGIAVINIGLGTPISGTFDAINWAAEDHFLNVQVNTGSGLVDLGTTQFMTVPYAQNAKVAENVSGLETLDEGNGTGWRLKGKNLNNYGNIGENAIDLSTSTFGSSSNGATGNISIAIGRNTKATGDRSTAFGVSSEASGANSTAFGESTTASGLASTSMGFNTSASGDDATALGSNTLAIGFSSTAMGDSTTASGFASTSMGSGTTASGSNATAIGIGSEASGDTSIAMGSNTTASSGGAFAVGTFTNASGIRSTAMGSETLASGINSTALGFRTRASGNHSTAMGSDTSAPSYIETAIGMYNTEYVPISENSINPVDRLFTIGNGTQTNFRSDALIVLKNGTITAPSLDLSEITDDKALITKEYLETNGTTGLEALDEGNGIGWRLKGKNPDNYGDIGENALDFSTNDGTITNAGATGVSSVAFGFRTEASGDNSTAIGFNTIASGSRSTASGNGTIALGDNSISMGSGTVAEGVNSTAMGVGTTASGDQSTAMGFFTEASGEASKASGNNTTASGFSSTAMGGSTTASGSSSTAMGGSTLASGDRSTAMGFGTNATGSGSTAMGNDTVASGDSSTAMGSNNIASGTSSTALGAGTNASGNISIAMGRETIAPSSVETVIGQYNTTYTAASSSVWNIFDRLFVVGNGTSTSNRNNALTLMKNGDIGINKDNPENILDIETAGSDFIRLKTNTGGASLVLDGNSGNSEVIWRENSGFQGSIGWDTNGQRMFCFVDGNVWYAKNGRLGVRDEDPTYALELPNNNNFTVGRARANAWETYSDARVKTNGRALNYGLKEVMQLIPKSYNQHTSSFLNGQVQLEANPTRTIGLFAQEVFEIIPEAVNKPENENEDLWAMDYEKLVPVLINAIQEQQKIIEAEKATNTKNQELILSLLSRVGALEHADTN